MAAAEDRPSFVAPLPARPNLEMQQKRAKDLVRAVWSGDADALKRVAALHPKPPEPGDLTLADAQLVVARGYGFESWAALKHKIESLTKPPIERFLDRLHHGDVTGVRALLEQYPEVRAAVNEPISYFDGRPVARATKNLEMLDLLMSYGADLNLKSTWWAGGFGVLEYDCTPEQAARLIERGAIVDVFAAASLGMFDRLRELIERDPSLVHARGGDGKTPLHCASTVQIAEYLLEHGADIDARDVDHESTPAQYLVRTSPDVARLLVDRGAWFDIFIAVALNDRALVDRCLREDPQALDHRTGRGKYSVAHNGMRAATVEEIGDRRGDTYRWVFDHNVSAMDVASMVGHRDMVERLAQAATPAQRLLAAAARADRVTAESILAAHPGLVATLTREEMRLMADRAQAGDTPAVRLMRDLGFDPRVTGPDGGDALHWAAFRGNAEMVRDLLQRNPAIGARDAGYNATALGWCIFGAVNGWMRDTGDFAGSARQLLAAGEAFDDPSELPTGCDPLDSVLRAHLQRAKP